MYLVITGQPVHGAEEVLVEKKLNEAEVKSLKSKPLEFISSITSKLDNAKDQVTFSLEDEVLIIRKAHYRFFRVKFTEEVE